jgi:hypothetical protein
LEEYAFGRLSEPETCKVEEHLLVCESCQELLGDVDQNILLMKRAIQEPAALAPPPRITRYVVAGSIAAAVVIGVIWPRANPQPAETVNLVALRGVEMARIHAGRPADLRIEMPDLADAVYRVEVVDATGRVVWAGQAPAEGRQLRVSEPRPLKSGVYWIRLYSPSGKLLREFGLEASTAG